MATYQRQLGSKDVYDTSGAQPRYISFDEAQKNNIWNQVQDVPVRTLDNRSPASGAETSLNFDRGTQPDSYGIFNNALMEMLKKAQTFGTKPLQQSALDMSTAQAQRGMAQATPGMSPSQQSAIRSADMQALNPSIQGVQDSAQTFSEQISGLKGLIGQVQTMGQSLQDQQFKNQQQAAKMINDSMTQLGSAAFEGLDPKELATLEKSAGLPAGYLSRKAKTLKEEEQINNQLLDQKKLAIDQQNANRLSSGGGTSGGGGGSITTDVSKMSQEAQAVLNGTIRLEDLTPTLKGKIAGELNAAGFKSTPKLSSTQQDEIATMETVKDLMSKVENYNADGQLEGVGGFWQGSMGGLFTQYFGTGSEEAKNVRALISNVKGTIAKLRGGTSFTPNEQKMLENYTPTIDESAASVLSKIEMLKYAIDKKKTELLNVAQDRKLPSQNNAEDLRTKYNY